MDAGGPTSLPFGSIRPANIYPFFPPLEPMRMTEQHPNGMSIAWAKLAPATHTRCSLALQENQQPGLVGYAGANIGANVEAFQLGDAQDSFGPSLNFGSNESPYGSSSFPAIQYPVNVPVDFGAHSCARTPARSVL